MHLSSFRAVNFRNHRHFQLESPEKTTVIIGPNGSGKTNIVEAIALLLSGFPPAGRSLSELLREGESVFRVSGIVSASHLDTEFAIAHEVGHRSAKFGIQKEGRTRAQYLDAMPFWPLYFAADELNLLYGNPEPRRDFLDTICALAHREYPDIMSTFRDALRARNAALRSISHDGRGQSELAMWDGLFLKHAELILSYRLALVQSLVSFSQLTSRLIPKSPTLTLSYRSKIDTARIRESLAETCARLREKEMIVGHSLFGPQTDDWDIMIEKAGSPIHATDYLSRGENKSLLFLLKYCTIDYVV